MSGCPRSQGGALEARYSPLWCELAGPWRSQESAVARAGVDSHPAVLRRIRRFATVPTTTALRYNPLGRSPIRSAGSGSVSQTRCPIRPPHVCDMRDRSVDEVRAVRAEWIQRLDVCIDDVEQLGCTGRNRQHVHHTLSRRTVWIDGERCWQDQSLRVEHCFGTNNYVRKVGLAFSQDAQAKSLDRPAYDNILRFAELQVRTGHLSRTLPSPVDRDALRDRQSLDRKTCEHLWGPYLLGFGRMWM